MPTIQAKEHQIKDVFSNEYAFSIPPYQRPYSWGVDQAEALFDDLVEASTGFSPGNFKHPVSPYFLGSIVLIKDDKSPESEVIDGQQRLPSSSPLKRRTTCSRSLMAISTRLAPSPSGP